MAGLYGRGTKPVNTHIYLSAQLHITELWGLNTDIPKRGLILGISLRGCRVNSGDPIQPDETCLKFVGLGLDLEGALRDRDPTIGVPLVEIRPHGTLNHPQVCRVKGPAVLR